MLQSLLPSLHPWAALHATVMCSSLPYQKAAWYQVNWARVRCGYEQQSVGLKGSTCLLAAPVQPQLNTSDPRTCVFST
eukprot:m.33752 g.33752  ORF g.33752 m.33752 type:complete len:78 (-) comp12257_c0_seq3:809-1042(-)